jgi:1,4-dihydroxy-2-naphthoate octaprenyltransferase
MYGAWHEWISPLLCLLLAGAVIKLMDDYLDAPFDLSRGKQTLANRLGRAILPYVLVMAFLAAYLDPTLSTAVYLASYALGMVCNPRERLPTHLYAYVEIIVALLLSCLVAGWQLALWSLSMMAVIDWLDDIIDASGDKVTGQSNLAIRIGTVETVLLLMVAFCTAVLTNVNLTVLTFVAVACLTVMSEFSTHHIWKQSSTEGERDN